MRDLRFQIHVVVLRIVMLFSDVAYQHLRGLCCLHLYG